ncbi:AP endonuclease [Ectopseudomonas mendocina]|uniref:AP endonuclease n=1 Tax=Ectopseudomonas mendocina TaxID=300 RepID=A0ABZ2REL5_ECTME
MQSHPVSISLSSFGADAVLERGQVVYIPLVAVSGASRVEWREELFSRKPEAAMLSSLADAYGLQQLYSCPLELWREDGQLEPQVMERMQLARDMGAVALKVSLGHWRAECDLQALKPLLEQGPELYVENDQTPQGGSLERLLGFFEAAQQQGVAPGMTFDIGNWQWQGESPEHAAQRLGRWVRYVHCKAVKRREDGRLVAIPPQERDLDQWRELLRHFQTRVPLAIEYPLAGTNLPAITRQQVTQLAELNKQVSHV